MIEKNKLKIAELAKEKSIKRQKEVLDIISLMIKNGEKVTFYSVQKKTGASKSYLYNNLKIKSVIQQEREEKIVNSRTDKSKDAIIKALKMTIKNLEKEIKELKSVNEDSYKLKYEKVLIENKELKKQLKNAYDY
ncbi:transposase [Clostridium perfringens]|uniref:DUF6262 family protein n=1 Tax=Clostridium TaxID=1485 RepID=UPI00016BCFB8|nr:MULTISPECIES: DUF6262 family protein [Clostridium]EDT27864.1 transposase C [Clostridium perfringens CPE str. F4969]EGT0681184.1 transposase [Clostridium perfringens]EIF6157497.1 transposase [Clostridium perfringens]MDU2093683.1 DUF6262 family protein [Clostridium perfringens]MDU2226394.1 DUF6262 family protein [Clostridium perfringens]